MTKKILLTPVRTSDTQNTSMVSPNTQTLYAPRANQEKPDEYGLVNFKQINELDEKTLNSAKAYTDSEITTLKKYVDEQDNKVLEDAKVYTYSKNEIDTKDTNTLNSAKAYTDERIPAILNANYYTKQEVDERDDGTLTEAEEYTRAYTYDKATINNKVDDVKKLAEGNLKALSFDDDNQIKAWIAGTYTYTDTVTGEVIAPNDTFIGQNIYNKNLTQSDYWVSKKPITKIEDLTILITDKSTLNASNVMFDSSNKNILTATNVQAAIDEISSDFADKNFVYEHSGYQTQVDYNAVLENNIIRCTLDETVSDLELYNNTTYLIHIYLPLVTLTGELDDSYTFQLKDKAGNIINLNTIYQEDITNTANVGNMCQVQEYDVGIGYSWTFDAHYKIITENSTTVRLFVTDTIIRETNTSMSGQALYAAINNSKLAPNTTVLCMSDYTSNGTTFTKGHNYKIIGDYTSGELILSWEDITPAKGGGVQDYSIVESEPTDKSEGKMIYQKTLSQLGEATINKTASGFYSKPDDVFSKISSGTATATDLENYEYILSSDNGYLLGYINLGDLTALAEYTGTTLTLYYKINNGEEQSETLTKNEDGGFVGNNLTIFTTSNLGVSVPTNYFTATIQNDTAFTVATTDTIEITRLNINGTYITPGQIADSFNINNLKIADGEKYIALNDMVGSVVDTSLSTTSSNPVENKIITSEFNKKLENNSVLFTITADKWQDLAGKEPYKFSATIDCDYSIKTTGEPVYELINNNPVNFANYGFALNEVSFGTPEAVYLTPKFTFYAIEKPTASVNLRVLITATSVELTAQSEGGITL